MVLCKQIIDSDNTTVVALHAYVRSRVTAIDLVPIC